MLLLALPVVVLSVRAIAALERALHYRAIAFIEVGGYAVFNVSAIVLALADFGYWAPVAAYWLWQSMTTIASYAITRYRPRLRFSVRGMQEIVGYGSGYTVAEWTWQIRD